MARSGTGAGRTRPAPRPRGRSLRTMPPCSATISLKSFIASIRQRVCPASTRWPYGDERLGWSGPGRAVEGADHRAGDPRHARRRRPRTPRRRPPPPRRGGRRPAAGAARRTVTRAPDISTLTSASSEASTTPTRVSSRSRSMAGCPGRLAASAPQRAATGDHLLGGLGEHGPEDEVLLGEALGRLLGRRRPGRAAACAPGSAARGAASRAVGATGPRRRPARPSATWDQLGLDLGPAAALDDVPGGLGQDRGAERIGERGPADVAGDRGRLGGDGDQAARQAEAAQAGDQARLQGRRHGDGGAEDGRGGLAQAVGRQHRPHHARGAVEGRRAGSRGGARRRRGRRAGSRPRGARRRGRPGPAEACTDGGAGEDGGGGRQGREAARGLHLHLDRQAGGLADGRDQAGEGGRATCGRRRRRGRGSPRRGGRPGRRASATQRASSIVGGGADDQGRHELGRRLLAGPRRPARARPGR